MVATAIYSVTMMLWKETAFPLFIIIIIVYYAEEARHTDNRYYNTTQKNTSHATIKHSTGEIK